DMAPTLRTTDDTPRSNGRTQIVSTKTYAAKNWKLRDGSTIEMKLASKTTAAVGPRAAPHPARAASHPCPQFPRSRAWQSWIGRVRSREQKLELLNYLISKR